jgi:hypothetical protein
MTNRTLLHLDFEHMVNNPTMNYICTSVRKQMAVIYTICAQGFDNPIVICARSLDNSNMKIWMGLDNSQQMHELHWNWNNMIEPKYCNFSVLH